MGFRLDATMRRTSAPVSVLRLSSSEATASTHDQFARMREYALDTIAFASVRNRSSDRPRVSSRRDMFARSVCECRVRHEPGAKRRSAIFK